MNDLKPDIDLGALERPRPQLQQPRRWKMIYAIPLVVIAVFLLILFTSLGDLFKEKIKVTVIRPQSISTTSARSGSVILQAAGWVEPEPFAITATALTGGVVEEVLVNEADEVKKGQIIARIVDTAKKLVVLQKQSAVQRARAELTLAEVEAKNAVANFEAPIVLIEAMETATARFQAHEFECQTKTAALKAHRAAVAVAKAELETQNYLAREDAAGPWQVELAQARYDEAKAKEDQFVAAAKQSRALLEVTRAQLKRAREDLMLRLADHLLVDGTKAKVSLKKASVAEASSALAYAAQHLDWCTVRSPADGIVMARLALPGSVVSEEKHGISVCTLYDPKELRLRVDVPQTDITKVHLGQEVVVTTSAKKETYAGTVIRILDEADIQKVTLQVHVKIADSDKLIKPEMLCQARFIAAETGGQEEGSTSLSIPKNILIGGNKVWVVDARGKEARLRTLKLGAAVGDRVEVLEGINESDKLIDRGRESLEEGTAITVVEEK